MHCFLLNYVIVPSDLKEKRKSDTASLIEMKILVQMKVPLPAERSD